VAAGGGGDPGPEAARCGAGADPDVGGAAERDAAGGRYAFSGLWAERGCVGGESRESGGVGEGGVAGGGVGMELVVGRGSGVFVGELREGMAFG